MNKKLIGCALAIFAALGAMNAQADSVFQGQSADGTFDPSCTVNGPNQCVMYWDAADNIEILNNWSIATGTFSQAGYYAEIVGSNSTGVTGWVLPTADGTQIAGPMNQWVSIWNQSGGTLNGLQNQFHGLQPSVPYWANALVLSGSASNDYLARVFDISNGTQNVLNAGQWGFASTLAVHNGLISPATPPVPLPASVWLLLSGLGGLGFMNHKRKA